MDVAVNLSVDRREDFRKIVGKARDLGLKVTASLDGIGVASGRIDRDRLPQLRRLPGVTVEEDRSVHAF